VKVTVEPLRGVADDVDDVREGRIGPHAVDGHVEVAPAQQLRSAPHRVRRAQPHHADHLIDADVGQLTLRQREARIEEVPVGRRRRAARARVGIVRVDDVDFLLVEPSRRCVCSCVPSPASP
jgi:hypothetical protein